MKKISVLFLSLVALVAVFTSCNPIVDAPEITVTPDMDTVYVAAVKTGTTVTFTVVMTPHVEQGAEIASLTVTEGTTELVSRTYAQGANSVTDTFTYVVAADHALGNIDLVFETTDDGGRAKSATATIVVAEDIPAFPAIVTGSGTVNYNSTSTTTEFGWQLTATAKGVTVTQVNSADADLTFFFNDTYRQQLLSPDAAQIEAQDTYSTWDYDVTGKKTTKIGVATASDWTNATDESINNLSVTSEVHPGGGNGVDLVAADDVFAIELSDGRKGLAKVTASNPPYKKGIVVASSITLEFKFQATPNSAK